MEIKLIIQSPRYQQNVGYIARVAKNFGINKLYFIKPRANIAGKTAITYSKHASDLLRNAVVYNTLDEAIKDCDLVIGSTGIWSKAKSGHKNVLLASYLPKFLKDHCAACKVALILGRDDIGMVKEELEKCDIIVFIPASPDYPVLNVSHALAILLYELSKNKLIPYYGEERKKPQKEELKLLFKEFDRFISKNKSIRNKKTVSNLFKKLILRARPDQKETHALISAFKY